VTGKGEKKEVSEREWLSPDRERAQKKGGGPKRGRRKVKGERQGNEAEKKRKKGLIEKKEKQLVGKTGLIFKKKPESFKGRSVKAGAEFPG